MARYQTPFDYQGAGNVLARFPRSALLSPNAYVPLSRPSARIANWCPLLVLSLFVGNSASGADSPYDKFRNSLVAYFQPLYLVPVLLPRGQKVGDVYDTQDFRLLSSSSECFPNLKPSGPIPGDLPAVSLDIDTSVAIAVGVPSLASADASLGTSRQVHITYSDVRVSTASIGEISHAYSAAKCPSLSALVHNTYVAAAPDSPPLVLGEVYSAKKTITFALKRSAGGGATFDLSKFLSRIGMSASVTAKGKADAGDSITVVSNQVLPIAIRPAFVARHFVGSYMGPDAKPVQLPGITWEPFSKTNPSHQEAFTTLISAYCTSPSCASEPVRTK